MEVRKAILDGYGTQLTAELVRSMPMYLAGVMMKRSFNSKSCTEPFGIKRFCTDGWGATPKAFTSTNA